jgi:cell division protein FtsQ
MSPKFILAAAAGVLCVVLVGVLATGERGHHLAQDFNLTVNRGIGGAGLKLRTVHVEGASPMATADIVKAAGVYKDQPLFGLDLEALRKRIEQVGWVKEARVVRLLPDTVVISVVERRQMAVWQHDGHSEVIDERGQPIPEADAGRFATLPLIVGDGANIASPSILPVIAQRPRLMSRLDALVRVDGRRWDLRLKDGSLIQLPAVDEEEALMRLEQLDLRSRILELGFERIDLRNPDVVAVRPRGGPQPAPNGQAAAAGV